VKQRDVFLESEGDAWLRRNVRATRNDELLASDPLVKALIDLPLDASRAPRILEIGCADGARLGWLHKTRGFDCYGIEPSAQAVAAANARGVAAKQGTAERLPFADAVFDIVMFGFCLYLCDREDLFRIAAEADRVLKNPGWLLILDFYSTVPLQRAYEHRAGVFSHKMDYRTLFTWHPTYVNYSHTVAAHLAHGYTDDPQEWVATTVLRKNRHSSE
jgi:SAM-dependent methyltransferase